MRVPRSHALVAAAATRARYACCAARRAYPHIAPRCPESGGTHGGTLAAPSIAPLAFSPTALDELWPPRDALPGTLLRIIIAWSVEGLTEGPVTNTLPATTYTTSCARQLPAQFQPIQPCALRLPLPLHTTVLGTACSRAGACEIFVEFDDRLLALLPCGPRVAGRNKHDGERFLSNGVGAGELNGEAPAILKAQCEAAELAHRITETPRDFNAIDHPRVKTMLRGLDQAEGSSQMWDSRRLRAVDRAAVGRELGRCRRPICLAVPAQPPDRSSRSQVVVREQRSCLCLESGRCCWPLYCSTREGHCAVRR